MARVAILTHEQSALLNELAAHGITASIRCPDGASSFVCSLSRSSVENISRRGETIEVAIDRATDTARMAWFDSF